MFCIVKLFEVENGAVKYTDIGYTEETALDEIIDTTVLNDFTDWAQNNMQGLNDGTISAALFLQEKGLTYFYCCDSTTENIDGRNLVEIVSPILNGEA